MPPEFQIAKRSQIKMTPPQFLCDKPIHPQITSPLPNRPFFMAVIGSAGSGKTSMMINLLRSKKAYYKAFHSVHVVVPTHSVASMKSNIFKSHDKLYDELTFDVLENIHEHAKEDADECLNSILILDDVTASMKDADIQRLLKELIYNRRHLRLSIMILVQSYIAIPLSIRKTLSHFISFKPRNKKEFNAIFDEIVFLDRDTADRLLQFVFDKPHAFLFCDIEAGLFHKDFDLLNIE